MPDTTRSGTRPTLFRSGDLVLLTRAASPQFVRPTTVRVIRELTDRHPYDGWFWFEGYELNADGSAVRRRELYALREGVRRVPDEPARPARRRPVAHTPVRA